MNVARLAELEAALLGYATALGFFGRAVADNGAEEFLGHGILVPTRRAALFCRRLEQGLRVAEPVTLMSVSYYNEPAGACSPSITI